MITYLKENNTDLSVDKSNMRQVILDFPKQFKVGFGAGAKIKNQISKIKNINNVIVCGMGGSALPGELLKLICTNYLKTTKAGVHIHRNYGLPYYIKSQKLKVKSQLIVCISYSGNTEETLSSYREAIKMGLPIVSIASGGKLLELSKKYKSPVVIIPGGIQPRSALGYQFAALIKILENLKIIKNIEKEILNAAENFAPKKLDGQGKNLAKKLLDKIPVVYSSQRYKALAYIWKIKFNENTKIPAFWNYFPELNHNEMVGYANASKLLHVLILRDKNDYPRNLKRMGLTAELLKNRGLKVEFIEIVGKSIWEKILNNLILADWVSYYMAIFEGVDPTPVAMVEEFKKKLE